MEGGEKRKGSDMKEEGGGKRIRQGVSEKQC